MTLAAFIERSHQEKENWKYTPLESLLPIFQKPPHPSQEDILSSLSMPLNENTHVSSGAAIPDHTRLLFLNGVWRPEGSYFGTLPSGF